MLCPRCNHETGGSDERQCPSCGHPFSAHAASEDSENTAADHHTQMLKKLIEDVKKSLDETFDDSPPSRTTQDDNEEATLFSAPGKPAAADEETATPDRIIAEFDLDTILNTPDDTGAPAAETEQQRTSLPPQDDNASPEIETNPPRGTSSSPAEASNPTGPAPVSSQPGIRLTAVMGILLAVSVLSGGGLLMYLRQQQPEIPSIALLPQRAAPETPAKEQPDETLLTPAPLPPDRPQPQQTDVPDPPKKPSGNNDIETDEIVTRPIQQSSDNPQPQRYVIHTDSFKTRELAAAEADRLLDLSFPAFVAAFTSRQAGSWFRVLVGPYRTRRTAQTVQTVLQTGHGKADARVLPLADTNHGQRLPPGRQSPAPPAS